MSVDNPYVASEPAGRSSGSRMRVVAVLAAFAGIAVIAAVAVRLGDAVDGSGAGADSSAAAVTGFMQAISDESVIDMASFLPPSEVGHVAELYGPGIAFAQKEGELAGDDPFAGVDITISGLEVDVDELHPSVHRVYLDEQATIRVVTDPTRLDPALREGARPVDETVTVAEMVSQTYPVEGEVGVAPRVFLTTIEEGGRWYVSPLYTSFEYVRDAYGLEVPDFGASREAENTGADSPSAVIEGVIDGLDDIDEQYLLEAFDEAAETLDGGSVETFSADSLLDTGLIAPDEVDVFLDYAPLFTELATEVQQEFSGGSMGGSIAEDGFLVEVPDKVPAAPEGSDAFPFDDPFADPNADPADMIDEMRRAIEESGLTLEVTSEMETAVETLGDDRARVTVLRLLLRGEAGWQEPDQPPASYLLELEVSDGTCGRYLVAYEDSTGSGSMSDSGCLEDSVDVELGVDGAFIVTRRIEGEWYWSPVETMVEYGRVALEAALGAD